MRFAMVQPVTEMTRAALSARLAPGASEYLNMFHDEAVFEFPFGAHGPVHIKGKAAMADYLASIEGSTVFEPFKLASAHPIRENGMILEYKCRARVGEAGPAFEQQYVAVVETDGGRIRLYREYLDPLNIPGVADRASDAAIDRTPLGGAVTTFDAILKANIGDRLAPGANSFLDMFAEGGVLECPFAPAGALRRLAGRAAIAAYYEQLTTIQGSDGVVLTANCPAEDQGYALLEYDGTVRNQQTGAAYRQRYLAVVGVRNGRVILFREY